MDIFRMIETAKTKNASDLHLAAGNVPLIRVDGELTRVDMPTPLPGMKYKRCSCK